MTSPALSGIQSFLLSDGSLLKVLIETLGGTYIRSIMRLCRV